MVYIYTYIPSIDHWLIVNFSTKCSPHFFEASAPLRASGTPRHPLPRALYKRHGRVTSLSHGGLEHHFPGGKTQAV